MIFWAAQYRAQLPFRKARSLSESIPRSGKGDFDTSGQWHPAPFVVCGWEEPPACTSRCPRPRRSGYGYSSERFSAVGHEIHLQEAQSGLILGGKGLREDLMFGHPSRLGGETFSERFRPVSAKYPIDGDRAQLNEKPLCVRHELKLPMPSEHSHDLWKKEAGRLERM